MSTKRKLAVVEPIYELAKPINPQRYLVSKVAAADLVERALKARPGAIVRLTTEEMRIWREHVVVING